MTLRQSENGPDLVAIAATAAAMTISVYVGRPPLALKGTRGRMAEAERGGILAPVGDRQEQGSEHASSDV